MEANLYYIAVQVAVLQKWLTNCIDEGRFNSARYQTFFFFFFNLPTVWSPDIKIWLKPSFKKNISKKKKRKKKYALKGQYRHDQQGIESEC